MHGGQCATQLSFARSTFLHIGRFNKEFKFDEVVLRDLPDIVVLTAGAWLKDSGDFYTLQEYVHDKVKELERHPSIAGKANSNGSSGKKPIQFIWKLQNAMHVNCSHYRYPISQAQLEDLDLLSKVGQYNWHLFPGYDQMAKDMARDLNPDLVRIMDMSPLQLRPDAHPGSAYLMGLSNSNRFVDAEANDCAHYCLPGPLDLFAVIMLQWLYTEEI
eukprot:gene24720-33194_t